MEYLLSLIDLINEMSFYLLLGCLVAGILHVVTPQSFYRKFLSKNDFKSVLWASLFGIPLPLCSCGVIPTAVSVYKEGASKGATVSFLTSTPQTGIDSIMATYGVFGLPFALIRPIVAFITALCSGMVINRFDREEVGEAKSGIRCADVKMSPLQKSWEALKYGFLTLLQNIGGHMVAGLLIAALISVLVPDSFFLYFQDKPVLELLSVLVIAIPMYVCSTGSIPVAAALMLKGLSPGAALVFLIAGPATNFASLLVISKVMGKKTTGLYLSVLIVFAIAAGFVINNFLPAEWFTQVSDISVSSCCAEGTTPLWKWISTGIFLILLANALILKHISKFKNRKIMKNEVLYSVVGMSCNHCKASVEKNIAKIEGVESATADLASASVLVKGEHLDDEAIRQTVEDLGFEFKGRK